MTNNQVADHAIKLLSITVTKYLQKFQIGRKGLNRI